MSEEVLLSKSESIERCIARVRETYVAHEVEFASSHDRQYVVVLNLQRACEMVIDMANRMVRLRRPRYPKDSNDSFIILNKAGLIDAGMTTTLKAMVGFRNIVMHQYKELDLDKVRAIIEHRLDELLAFSKVMLQADPSAWASPPR